MSESNLLIFGRSHALPADVHVLVLIACFAQGHYVWLDLWVPTRRCLVRCVSCKSALLVLVLIDSTGHHGLQHLRFLYVPAFVVEVHLKHVAGAEGLRRSTMLRRSLISLASSIHGRTRVLF